VAPLNSLRTPAPLTPRLSPGWAVLSLETRIALSQSHTASAALPVFSRRKMVRGRLQWGLEN
jgi:hypothetical protein